MKKFSRQRLTLYYLTTQKMQPFASMREIFNAQNEAAEWYCDMLPESFKEEKAKILKEYGFDEDLWVRVLKNSSSMMFVPTEATDNINKAMRALMHKWVLMNGVIYQTNAMAAALHNDVDHKYILKEKRGDLWVYCLKSETLEQIYNALKQTGQLKNLSLAL